MTIRTSDLIPFLLAIVLSGCATSPQTNWSETTLNDIEAAHEHTVASHPGYVDPLNPDFAVKAIKAKEVASVMSRKVVDAAGYRAVLQRYSASFRDGHYGVFSDSKKLGLNTGYRWPGLFLAWRDDRTFVSHSENDPTLLHAALIQCDGTTAKDLVLRNVFDFDIGKPDQASYWARKTSDLFLDGGNPFIKRPSKCLFERTDGSTVELPLTWEPLPRERIRTLARAAQFGEKPNPGVREFSKGRYWINLPDFSPSDEMFDLMTNTIDRLSSTRDELRTADTLVFDMRGNQGGNSRWGVRAIEAIWGTDYRKSRQPVDKSAVDWRISHDNIKHAAYIVDFLSEQGDTTAVEYFAPIAEGMASAPEGQLYFRQPKSPELSVKTKVANPVTAKVLLLTHGICASSCLDFVDEMMRLENVTQIGYPTGSDTQYMEVRIIDLPSGYSKMVLPVKVYRNRPRAANEYYRPARRYDGLDWSDEALENWVQQEVLDNASPLSKDLNE